MEKALATKEHLIKRTEEVSVDQKNRGSIGQGAETSKRGDMLENCLEQ